MTLALRHALLAALTAALLGSAAAQNLVMAASAQPDTLDPQVTSATSAFQTTKSLYDTLVEVARDGTLVPSLASSWTASEDALGWTFDLVEARFHDGTAFDAADVVASLDRIRADETASPKAEEFAAITEVEALDDRTVRIHLERPAPALLATLASGWGAILPSEKIAEGHDFGTEPVGTGPFALEEWVRDSHLRLAAYEAYVGGAPAVDTVTIRFVQDSAVQLQGLLAGDFHIVDSVATADQPVVEERDEVQLVREPSGLVLVAAMNARRPFLDDARVRRALNLAVDEGVVLETAYGGGTPVGTFMEVGSPWLPGDVEPYGFKPEAAQQLLAEAGVPDDWTLDIALPQPYEAHVQAGQIVQDMLRDVGIGSEIRVVEWGVWLGEVYGGPRDFDLTVIGHTGKLDPTGRLDGYGDPEASYTGFDDADVVGWLDAARVETHRDARAQLYSQVLERMHERPPFVYFGTPDRTYAHRSDVSGFWMTPLLDTFDFRDARLD
jgi:peptide/nickel transport system substrate-binding protein